MLGPKTLLKIHFNLLERQKRRSPICYFDPQMPQKPGQGQAKPGAQTLFESFTWMALTLSHDLLPSRMCASRKLGLERAGTQIQ